MTVDKGYLAGSASLLVLSLLEKEDQYGYQIIRRLEERSQKVFSLQEGTLYPVLHKLENKGYITCLLYTSLFRLFQRPGQRGQHL